MTDIQDKLKAEFRKMDALEAKLKAENQQIEKELASVGPATLRHQAMQDIQAERERDRKVLSRAQERDTTQEEEDALLGIALIEAQDALSRANNQTEIRHAIDDLAQLKSKPSNNDQPHIPLRLAEPTSITQQSYDRPLVSHRNKGGWESTQLVTLDGVVQEQLPTDIEGYVTEDDLSQCTSTNWMYATHKDGTMIRHQLKCDRENPCPVCVAAWASKIKRLVREGIMQIPDGTPLHFVTITMPDLVNPISSERITETYREQYDRFRSAWREIRRNLPKFTFFRVFEFGIKNNRIHAHLIVAGDNPFPYAEPIEGNQVEQWKAGLSVEARARYEYLQAHGLGYYTSEPVLHGKAAVISYISKYVSKAENFPWKDIKGIRIHGSSKDFPKPPDQPIAPFDVKCPSYAKDPDMTEIGSIPEYNPIQYAALKQPKRLEVIEADMEFQRRGTRHPDTIKPHYTEIQDRESYINRIRNHIPTEYLTKLHGMAVRTEYHVNGHTFHMRQYPVDTHKPKNPDDAITWAIQQDFIHSYNRLQEQKKALRERHNYTGTWIFLRYYMVATSDPKDHADSNRRVESHYRDYYKYTGRDYTKDSEAYRMLVAISCIDHDPINNAQQVLDHYTQQELR